MSSSLRLMSGAGIALAVLAAASCSSSSGSSDTAGPSNAGLSATALLSKAVTAGQAASGVHVDFTVVDKSVSTKVDMHYGSNSAAGTVVVQGQPTQLIFSGGVIYFKATDAFWAKQFGARKGRTIVAVINGRWVELQKGDDGYSDFDTFSDKDGLLSGLKKPTGKVVKVAGKSVQGKQTLGLEDSGDGSKLYVLAQGDPYPVEVDPGKTGSGSGSFDEWDEPYTATAPASSEVIKLADLNG